MIELRKVTKYFKTKQGRKYILKDVTITIPSGRNVGILGRNGVGKSTLLRMLGGIDFPNFGKIVSPHTFSWPMGFAGGFQGNMTGRQNVKFVCRLFGKNEKEMYKVLDFVKEFSELGDYFDMPIKTYSSGMRSRLTFGLSLAFDFDYLLIDETLSVGDVKFKEKSKAALMKKIETSNVLMVSHSMKDILDICDSGIVLHDGEMFYFDRVEDAIKLYKEINVGTDYRQLFLTDRAFFFELFEEGRLIVKDNRLMLSFLGEGREYTVEVDDSFLGEVNPNMKLLLKQYARGEPVGERIVLAFVNMLVNLKRVHYDFDENDRFTPSVLAKEYAFFLKTIRERKHKFIKIDRANRREIDEKSVA